MSSLNFEQVFALTCNTCNACGSIKVLWYILQKGVMLKLCFWKKSFFLFIFFHGIPPHICMYVFFFSQWIKVLSKISWAKLEYQVRHDCPQKKFGSIFKTQLWFFGYYESKSKIPHSCVHIRLQARRLGSPHGKHAARFSGTNLHKFA